MRDLVLRYSIWIKAVVQSLQTVSLDGANADEKAIELLNVFDQKIFPKIPKNSTDRSSWQASFLQPLAELDAISKELENKISDIFVQRCCTALSEVATVVSGVRFATKGADSHSQYVTKLLKPASAYFVADVASLGIETALLNRLKINVADKVTSKYLSTITKILQSAEESDKFWLEKKKKKDSRKGGADSILASDKIRAQMTLDVKEYGNELQHFGIETSNLASYQELIASVVTESNK
ncbi:hypothetical protein HDU76_004430 [Blyttiomyces sp. JEL0837]|nr:hypothetical protein HDU76_004430 [Blyttiomyces sp. JEL0837]